MTKIFKPGERVVALVDGKRKIVILSLETEEKGDRRDHCWRYDKPWYPIIPKGVAVKPIKRYKPKVKKPA